MELPDELLQDDLNNGYDSTQQHSELGSHSADYFPSGADTTAPTRVGPGVSRGNNPLGTELGIHEGLVYKYRSFKRKG